MKAYLITTGLLFGVLAALHIWRIAAEWSRAASNGSFVVEMAVGTILPALLCWWAWRLLRLRSV